MRCATISSNNGFVFVWKELQQIRAYCIVMCISFVKLPNSQAGLSKIATLESRNFLIIIFGFIWLRCQYHVASNSDDAWHAEARGGISARASPLSGCRLFYSQLTFYRRASIGCIIRVLKFLISKTMTITKALSNYPVLRSAHKVVGNRSVPRMKMAMPRSTAKTKETFRTRVDCSRLSKGNRSFPKQRITWWDSRFLPM